MGTRKIKELPKLGEIKVPVRLVRYYNKENQKNNFSSNIAFWKSPEGDSEVLDKDGNKIGVIGSTIGGNIEMVRYYPYIGNSDEYKKSIDVIIDVRDLWDQIEGLLESSDVKFYIDGINDIQEKIYLKDKESKKKKDSDNKNNRKNISSEDREDIPSVTKNEDLGHINIEIYNNNWDLNEVLQGNDIEFYEKKDKGTVKSNRDKNGKIPINIGCGVKIKVKEGDNLYSLYSDNKNINNTVILSITSWAKVSADAIHFYGKLKFNLPNLYKDGDYNHIVSFQDIPLFREPGEIQLTRKLEAWEFDKYPGIYGMRCPGDVYLGFYSVEEVISRGEEVFNDLFGDGWDLQIIKEY